MTGGIVARFRTMDIARVSVLTGHVLGAVLKTVLALVVVIGFAFLLGFRSGAGPLEWPFTPLIETIRALTTGADTGGDAWAALGWCVAIALAGYLWSRRLFLRVPSK